MLPIDQIVPFIRHEDRLVVGLAMHCLKWVRHPHRLTADFVLDATKEGHPDLSRWLDDFECSAAVLEYAVETLKQPRGEGEPYGPEAIIKAPDRLFTPTVIEAVRGLRLSKKGWTRNLIRWRVEMMDWPTERLRERMLDSCREADQVHTAKSQQDELHALLDRLRFRGDSIEWASEQLSKHLGSNGWAEIWLFELLRKSGYHPLLDMVMSRWPQITPDENEALAGEMSGSVTELATPDDLPRIADLWEKIAPENHSYLIEAVGKLRLAEAEAAVLDFARRTDDPLLKTYAAMGLCEMLCTSEPAREFVRDLVETERFDTTMVELEELAIPLGVITGRPFDEAPAWRQRLEDPAKNAERRQRFTSMLGIPQDWSEKLNQLRLARESKETQTTRQLIAPATIERPAQLSRAATVGRNDPCPCGSGKKYKKCCLKK